MTTVVKPNVKVASAAILHFVVSKFWCKICLWDIDVNSGAKCCANVSHSYRVRAIKQNFQICSRRHAGFSRKWNLTSVKVAASPHYLHIKFGEDISIGSQVMVIYLFFLNGGLPFWILAKVKLGGISVSGTSILVSEPNFMRPGDGR